MLADGDPQRAGPGRREGAALRLVTYNLLEGGLPTEEALGASDHSPLWAEFEV